MMDNKFSEKDIKNYKKYAAAFFPGADADVLREGAALVGKKAAPNKSIPKNFLKAAKITNRERDDIREGWIQYSTHGP